MSNEPQTPPAFPEARKKQLSQRKRVWLGGLLGVLVCTAISSVIGFLAGTYDGRNGHAIGEGISLWILVGTLAILMVPAFVWTFKYWKSIDEMARRAHLDSWLWGGTLGATPVFVFGAVAAVFPEVKVEAFEQAGFSATQAFGIGAVALYTTMLLGYTIFWLFWWAKRR